MTSARYAAWKARVARWKFKYKVGEQPRSASPLFCAYCLTGKALTRHHKGHEYYFACVMEDVYAERYVNFHPDDIVVLCERHHKYLHKLYKPIIAECNAYLLLCKPERTKWTVTYRIPVSPAVLESFRQRLIHRCNHFLARKRARSVRK